MSRCRISKYRNTTVVISDCRTLIPIDAEPLKRAEQKKCKALLYQMDLTIEKLRHFSEESEPAFQQWLHSTFSSPIIELRELSQKRVELELMMTEVDNYRHYARCSYFEAYRALMERKNKRDVPSPDRIEQNESSDLEQAFSTHFESEFGSREDWTGPKTEYDAIYEALKESFKNKFGSDAFDSQNESRFSDDEPDHLSKFQCRPERAPEAYDSKLKTLYRALARKLHPDVNVELDHKRKELWHQVQEAYELKDVERLKNLSTISDVFDDNAHAVASVWSLKNLYEELTLGLKHLQRQVRQINKNIAWSFEKTKVQPQKLERLHEKIAVQMRGDKAIILNYIESYESQIEQWKTPPRPTPRQRRAKSRSRSQARYKTETKAFMGFIGKKRD